MKLIKTKKIPIDALNSVVAIGNFDGVHLGHKSVIEVARNLSRKDNLPLSVLTFEPHPKCFFNKRKSNFRITPFRLKFELIRNQKVKYYFNFKFDKDFSKITANEFINDILINRLKVSHVVTGFDFVFGYRQEGNTDLLEEISRKDKSFKCTIVEEFKKKELNDFSSSEVRRFLLEGNLEQVKKILGRNWSIKARVIKGRKMGRKIGYPTANVNISKYCDICFGVYEVLINFKGNISKSSFKGIANYGIKPTFNNSFPILEVYIFDFNQNIYGESIEVVFKSFIRKEKKFSNVDELKKQINEDIKYCK
ncbi:bifunctional riboflavin kinase/FAD synthetase [Rickettsiales bacterium]|nr:bifunctional riboflavin kinase/FAD synthetase [Rickettsiales bacterium]